MTQAQPAQKTLTITVDGQTIPARPGQTVIQAAMEAGIYIPYLCYWPGMKPYGACRMCVVEVEGSRGTPASCTLPVQDGMVVHTRTPLLEAIRKGILELLLSEHPHGCLTCHRVELCGPQDICLRHIAVTDRCVACPKNERCEFKDTVRFVGMELETPLTYHYRHLPLEVRDPFYDRDYNLCIVCGRCVRVCTEVRGDDAIGFVERSGTALVGTSFGTSLLESGCEFCGACVDVCPVGALVERKHKWEKPIDRVRTVCPHCPVGCVVQAEVGGRIGNVSDHDTHPWRLRMVQRRPQPHNRLIRSVGDWSAHNRGQLCFKGKFGLEFVNDRRRLTRPQVRRNGRLEEVSWDEALDLLAGRLQGYRDGSFALLVSPRATNEEAYLAGKFARAVMRTHSVDCASHTRPELFRPVEAVVGVPSATGTVWDLTASACVLVVNSNTTEEHNVLAVPLKMRKRNEGVPLLIVVDPREVELTRYADLWLRPRPGTEPLLLAGMVKALLQEGLVDRAFLEARSGGLDALTASVKGLSLERVSEATGVPLEDLRRAVRVLAERKPTAFLYALDNLSPAGRLAGATALVDLALLTGNLGVPGAGLYPLRLGANEQGAVDLGCAPDRLPGPARLEDPNARARVEEVWGVSLPDGEGVGVAHLAEAIRKGRVRALWVLGDSPTLHNGELEGLLTALEGLEFLAVSAEFPGSLTERAHLVLPSATFAEKEGTYTNLERRVQRVRRALDPRGESRPDWWVLCQVAQRMGAPGFDFAGPGQVWEEVRAVAPALAGLAWDRLEEGGLCWPCPEPDHPGTPTLGAEGPLRLLPLPEAKAEAPASVSSEYPLLFAPGRVLLKPGREVRVVQEGLRNTLYEEPEVLLHPEDASALGIGEGDPVQVRTPAGSLTGRARLEGPHRGVVYATVLFATLAQDLDRSREPDPMLRAPGLRVTPARVERFQT